MLTYSSYNKPIRTCRFRVLALIAQSLLLFLSCNAARAEVLKEGSNAKDGHGNKGNSNNGFVQKDASYQGPPPSKGIESSSDEITLNRDRELQNRRRKEQIEECIKGMSSIS